VDTKIEEFEHAGLTCEIHWEEDGEFCNPRDNDNLGIMLCWHPDYILGDKQFTNPDGRGGVKERFHRDDFESMEVLSRYLTLVEKAVVVLPLSIYDHSGITMFVGHRYPFDSQGWDTTTVGFIYTTTERIIECFPMDQPLPDESVIEGALRQEVKVYDEWLCGEVYWWCVRDSEGEMIESCGGYIGDIDYVKEEAKESAEALAKDILINQEPTDIAEILGGMS